MVSSWTCCQKSSMSKLKQIRKIFYGESILNQTNRFLLLLGMILLGGLILSACGTAEAETTPTYQPDTIRTLAVATFSSGLTQTALAMPSDTPTPTSTATATATTSSLRTSTPGGSSGLPTSIPSTASCYSMAFVADVTIPDNTEMDPGETFTKTWRVRNNGSCAWDPGFSFRSIGNEDLDGSTLSLDKTVAVGSETELSVEMTAPDSAGTYRSNWRMATGEGTLFGDEVYVIIIVSGTASSSTATTAPAATRTASSTVAPTGNPTETATP